MTIALPYNIQNGQALDAVPVMANLNALTVAQQASDVTAALVPYATTAAVTAALTPYAKNGANADITSLSVLSTPLSTVQGGTGDTGSSWTSVVPVITAASGSITTVSGSIRYKRIGKTVFYNVIVSITTNGTGAGTLVVSGFPFLANASSTSAGREIAVAGKSLTGTIATGGSQMNVQNYDNTYPGFNGAVIVINGVLETT
jgi:hypothetical protein